MADVKPEELRELMEQFSGTEQYHNAMVCKITDGMKAVADKAGAYWLVTEIGAHMKKPELKRHEMVFWLLKVKDGKADLEAWDDIPGNLLFKEHIAYTDFPEGEWKFYYQQGVLFLPSEY